MDAAISDLRLGDSVANPLQRGAATRVIGAAVQACGGDPERTGGTFAALAAASISSSQPPQTGGSELRKRKMSAVIDQSDETEIQEIPEKSMRGLFLEYSKTNGGDPLDHEECTSVQLTALGAKLAQDIAPYTDFAVWGPIWSPTGQTHEV